MKDAKRRRQPGDTYFAGEFKDCIDRMTAHILDGFDRAGKPHVLLGPVVWEPDPQNPSGKFWYFVTISGGENGTSRADKLGSNNNDGGNQAQAIRNALCVRLIAERPIVIHDCDDELELARWAEAIWPTEQNRRIRQNLEQERCPI